MHRTRWMGTWGISHEGVCPAKLVLFTVRYNNRSWTLKAPHIHKWLQSVSMWLTKFTRLIFFWDKVMLHTKMFCINTTKVQLIWRRTTEIHAQVSQGTFPSGISLLGIVWIRRSLVSSTATHRRCSPTSSLNHYKGHFSDILGKSLWDWCNVFIDSLNNTENLFIYLLLLSFYIYILGDFLASL